MDRMSPLDAAFLEAEDEEPTTSMGIASVAVFEGSPPRHEELLSAFESRLPLIPRYRQKVVSPLWDLGPPVWVDDPAFDLSFHVRRTALPAPGSERELFALMARLMAQRLDRSRPMWEVWVVEGLQDDKWAMVSKVHHCMVDGVSGTQIYHLLLSASPDEQLPEDLPEPWHPATPPSRALVTADAVRELATSPLRLAALVGGALRAPRDSAGRAADVIRGAVALSFNARPAKASTLIGEVGRQRRYAAVSASLRQVKAVCETYGVTVNDVALTAATAAFRSLLLARGEPCNPNTVRSLVPVSVRARGDEGILDNRVSCLLADLPVHVREPVDRLRAVHAHLAHLKTLKEAEAGAAVNDLATREPFVFVAPLVRIAFRLPQRNIVTVTTNVPGPRDALYLLGRRMVRLLPYVPIASRVRIGVAILSYCDELTFGVTGDYDTADVGLLSREISRALDELLAEAERTSADRETRDGRGVDPAAHRLQVAAMDHGDLRRGVAQ